MNIQYQDFKKSFKDFLDGKQSKDQMIQDQTRDEFNFDRAVEKTMINYFQSGFGESFFLKLLNTALETKRVNNSPVARQGAELVTEYLNGD